jgi:uncharacterized protein (TIGR02172 family)
MTVQKDGMKPGKKLAEGREAEIFAWGEGEVIKLFRGRDTSRVEHEQRIGRAAYEGGVQTPRPGEIVEWNDRPGIVYERVDGENIPQVLLKNPLRLKSLPRQFAELHVSLHRIPAPQSLPTAHEWYVRAIRKAKSLPDDLREGSLALLAELPQGDRLLHGDFHPENVIVSGERMVVIDLPNAVAGHPLADVARTCVILELGGTMPRGFLYRTAVKWLTESFYRNYLNRYNELVHIDRRMLKRWMIVNAAARLNEGIEGEEERMLPFIRIGLKEMKEG